MKLLALWEWVEGKPVKLSSTKRAIQDENR